MKDSSGEFIKGYKEALLEVLTRIDYGYSMNEIEKFCEKEIFKYKQKRE